LRRAANIFNRKTFRRNAPVVLQEGLLVALVPVFGLVVQEGFDTFGVDHA
jgi:hypothetical protein